MIIHLTLSWWAIPLTWFVISVVIVVIRNAFDPERGTACNFAPLVIDLPILLVGILGALGIVVGHFL